MSQTRNVATVTISRAGCRLKLSYGQVLRLVMRGELHGQQDDRGRWWIDADDLARYQSDLQEVADKLALTDPRAPKASIREATRSSGGPRRP